MEGKIYHRTNHVSNMCKYSYYHTMLHGYICKAHLAASANAHPKRLSSCHAIVYRISYHHLARLFLCLRHYRPVPDPDPLAVLFPTPTPLARLLGILPPELFLFLSSLVIRLELIIATPGLPINLASTFLASSLFSSLSFSLASCAFTLSTTELCFLGLYHPSLVKIVPGCSVPSSSEE
jgi:hypothetical protein